MTYSYTQISQYLSCPRRYKHRYLDGWREKDTRAAMPFVWIRKRTSRSGEPFTLDSCMRAYRTLEDWSNALITLSCHPCSFRPGTPFAVANTIPKAISALTSPAWSHTFRINDVTCGNGKWCSDSS